MKYYTIYVLTSITGSMLDFHKNNILVWKLLASFLSIALCNVNIVDGAKILGIFQIPSKSHHILGSALLRTLAKRGHDVTMISPFPFKDKIPNYRDIGMNGIQDFETDEAWNETMNTAKTSAAQMLSGTTFHEKAIEIVLNHKKVQELKKEHFDLVILYGKYSYALLGLPHHFKAPVIIFSTIGSSAMTDEYTGNPEPISYVPNVMSGAPAEMNFMQRVENVLLTIALKGINYVAKREQREQLRRHFPDAPSLEELMQNVSLVLLNSHYSIESPRPLLPNMIQIGGFHIEEAQKLPRDLQKFLDDAEHGAVLFSMGSNYKIANMDEDKLQAIMQVFGRFKVKVLFKSEIEILHAPKNVKVGTWFPQSDILAHPNVKAFISHGGLLSTTETVYRGVPIIGIPLFSDQMMNIAVAVQAGYAVKLNLADINSETFSAALGEILSNVKYRNNVKLRSSLLRDQPIKPMDNAVFWVEHVIKYKGARHLQNAGVKQTWYQNMLLDVILFIVTLSLASIWLIYFVIKSIVAGVCRFVRKTKFKTQ